MIAWPEPMCAVGLMLRDLGHGAASAWCAGYANGCYRYLAPESEYARGGYELATTRRYYGEPARVLPDEAAGLSVVSAAWDVSSGPLPNA